MTEKNIIKINTRKLVIASLLLTISLIVNYFRFTIPVGGAPVLRIALGGPFLKYIGLLFGPLYGGIAGGLADVISYLLKPENGFIWPLTVVAILKGASIAWLWKKLSNVNFKVYHKFYIAIFILFIILGITNYFMINTLPNSAYSKLLMTIGKKADYVSFGLLISGCMGLLMNFGASIFFKAKSDKSFFENYLILIVAIGIPSLLGTTINTFILKAYLYLPDKAFLFIWIPRFIEELIMVLFNTCVLCLLMQIPISINILARKKDQSV